MARLLQRLGAFSVRRRRTVLAAWLVALGVMAALSLSFAGEFTGNFSIPGTESQRANDLIQSKTPGADADAPSGRVVFAAPAGQTLASGAGRAAVERTIGAIERVPGVASASDPFESSAVSEDGRIAFTSVDFSPRRSRRRVAAGRHRAGIRRPRSTRGCRSSTPAPPPEADRAVRRASRSASCSASASPSSCWRSPSARWSPPDCRSSPPCSASASGSSASGWPPRSRR